MKLLGTCAVIVALLAAGCGKGSAEKQIDDAMNKAKLAIEEETLFGILAGNYDGDPVAQTYAYIAVVDEVGGVEDAELFDLAASLSASGCDPCADIVWDYAKR